MEQGGGMRRVGSPRAPIPSAGSSKRQNWITADFFTHSYRISGSSDVYRSPIADQLNDTNVSFIWAEQAYVSPIDRPGEITANYPLLAMRKDHIVLILLPTEEDGLTSKERHPSFRHGKLRPVFVTLSSFEVRGYLRLNGDFDVRAIAGLNLFVSIIQGSASSSLNPQVQFDSNMILINKDAIGVISIQD